MKEAKKIPVRALMKRPHIRIREIKAWLSSRGMLAAIERLCAGYRVPIEEALGTDKHQSPLIVRQHAWALVYDTLATASKEEMRRGFQVDHSTFLNGLRRHAERTARELGMGVDHAAE